MNSIDSKNSMNSTNSGRGFLGGLQFRQFLDTTGEWHALVQGFCEVLCPWPPRWTTMSESLVQEIEDEHHYYMAGRALGVLAWLTIGTIALANMIP